VPCRPDRRHVAASLAHEHPGLLVASYVGGTRNGAVVHWPASGSGVSEDYGADDNAFPGVINWVQIDTGKADNRHLISPEDRWRAAMARQ